MAKKTTYLSDLSGETAEGTVVFGIGGKWFDIDLTTEEKAQLESALEPYIKASRKSQKVASKGMARQVPVTTAAERKKIRQWGFEALGEPIRNGQIPSGLVRKYDEAHEITDREWRTANYDE